MANTIYGPYAQGAAKVTGPYTTGGAYTSQEANNAETQSAVALASFNPDQVSGGYVLYGATPTGTVGSSTLTIASGRAYLTMTDGTVARIDVGATTESTSGHASSTLYLDLNPDGTWSWGTAHSAQANYLAIAQVTTDSSSNIASVTDKRVLSPSLWPTLSAAPSFPGIATTKPSTLDNGLIATDGLGTMTGNAPTPPSAPTLTTASSGTATGTYKSTILADAPLRYYRMDASSGTSETDLGSQASNGTYAGGYTLAQTGALAGDTDTAASFNGTSGYVSLPTTGLPTGTSAWSMDCWVKLTAFPSAFGVVAEWGTAAIGQLAQIYVSSAGVPSASMASNDTSGAAALSLNTWYHLAATFSGGANGTLTLYVNGVASGTKTVASPNITLGYATIGAQQTGATSFTYYTNGTIDEVAFYATCLSATQVATHYNAGHTAPSALNIGTYKYAVTYATAASETALGSTATITTTSGNQDVNLSAIPTGPSGTTKRNLYRTQGGGSAFYVLHTISDNTTTTYSDTTPDTSLTTPWSTPTGGIAKWGGQATTGQFGMPLIVAQAVAQHITTTSQVTVLSYTPPANGLYRLNASMNSNNGGTNKPALGFTFTGGTSESNAGEAYFCTPNGSVQNGSQTNISNADISLAPQTAYCASGQPITVLYQNNSGTPNDYVTVVIERLA